MQGTLTSNEHQIVPHGGGPDTRFSKIFVKPNMELNCAAASARTAWNLELHAPLQATF
jgi:hypothetical protein